MRITRSEVETTGRRAAAVAETVAEIATRAMPEEEEAAAAAAAAEEEHPGLVARFKTLVASVRSGTTPLVVTISNGYVIVTKLVAVKSINETVW